MATKVQQISQNPTGNALPPSNGIQSQYPHRKKCISSLSDDELRPWIVDERYDAKIDEKITELNKFMTTCLPQKSSGARGESALDRPPDSLILLSDMVENENWIYDGDESLGEGSYFDENENDQNPDNDDANENYSPETIAQDPEILELTTKLSSLNPNNQNTTTNNNSSSNKIKDQNGERGEEDDRMLRYALHLQRKKKKKQLRTAAYMPNMKSKMYKEWLETQFAKSLSAPSDVWRRDDDTSTSQRPSTANITSFFAQQGVNDEEYFGMRPQTSSSSSSSSSNIQSSSTLLNRFQTPPSPIRQLAPLNELNNPNKDTIPRPQTQSSYHSRPTTQQQQQLSSTSTTSSSSSLLSPIGPLATPPSSHGSRPLTRSGMNESFPPPAVVFPTSNTDTIPSSNSAIVKYKSSRDYMLDTLALPSKEQREKALKRSIERGSPLPLKSTSISNSTTATQQQQQGNQHSSRFETNTPKSNPLAKIAIANDKGTAVSSAAVYQKHQLRKVRTLRDRLLTTTGSSTLFSTNGHSLPPDVLNPVRTHHTNLLAAQQTRELNEEDHTTELLKIPGFLENIGPNNFYMTNNVSVFSYPENAFNEAILNRDAPAVTRPDLIKVWAEDALSHGRKLFCYGGGGFHFAK